MRQPPKSLATSLPNAIRSVSTLARVRKDDTGLDGLVFMTNGVMSRFKEQYINRKQPGSY